MAGGKNDDDGDRLVSYRKRPCARWVYCIYGRRVTSDKRNNKNEHRGEDSVNILYKTRRDLAKLDAYANAVVDNSSSVLLWPTCFDFGRCSLNAPTRPPLTPTHPNKRGSIACRSLYAIVFLSSPTHARTDQPRKFITRFRTNHRGPNLLPKYNNRVITVVSVV